MNSRSHTAHSGAQHAGAGIVYPIVKASGGWELLSDPPVGSCWISPVPSPQAPSHPPRFIPPSKINLCCVQRQESGSHLVLEARWQPSGIRSEKRTRQARRGGDSVPDDS